MRLVRDGGHLIPREGEGITIHPRGRLALTKPGEAATLTVTSDLGQLKKSDPDTWWLQPFIWKERGGVTIRWREP